MQGKIIRFLKVLRGKDKYYPIQCSCNKLNLGKKGASFTICPDKINHKSIVYSFGVGQDITFDLALINQYNLQIFAYDPTPKSIEWLKQQNYPSNFNFQPYGLAAFDGKTKFHLPANPLYVSGSIIKSKENSEDYIEVEMRKLLTLMERNKHSSIDILKMDIEGAEYEVISDILNSNLNISQILIEFHHRLDEFGIDKTTEAIKQLNKFNYKIFDISNTGEEISFIRL